jgi:hypothetical protein
MILASWAVVGFDGLAEYPAVLQRLADFHADRGYSLVAFGIEAGLPDLAADAMLILVGGLVLVGVIVAARRAPRDEVAFSIAIVASLALTPIVWLHYFTLLIVPLALWRPRFSWVWGLLWLFWIIPVQENAGALWPILLAYAIVAAVLVRATAARPSRVT